MGGQAEFATERTKDNAIVFSLYMTAYWIIVLPHYPLFEKER
jgi:hypothetical protein